MKLIGFNLTKMNLEKKSDNLKDLKVTTGIDISDLKEVKSDFFSSSEGLIAVKFEYTINYEKNIALLKFYGSLIVSVESKQAKEALNQWKDKKLPEGFRLAVFNLILRKASLKALQFEEELNLPPHIPLPSFRPQEKKK
ncbi:MAG: hypothetical protein NTZ83_05305 [Candidatus Pacearchaeota archaeon]|nr:hypothetical protein [Candidatus Pacearchaeota archaeon]